VLHLDRLDDLENDEFGMVSPSSATRFLVAARLWPLTLLLSWACCMYVPGCCTESSLKLRSVARVILCLIV